MEVSDQLHAPAGLPPGKEPLMSLDRRLGGPQNRCGRRNKEQNSQPLPPGIEPWNPDRTTRSLVAIPTELSWLFHRLYELADSWII
jgi:hypothetical protein